MPMKRPLTLLALMVWGLLFANAGPSVYAQGPLPTSEAWRWATLIESTPQLSTASGRGVGNVFTLQSSRAIDAYVVFPTAATPRRVTSAYVYLLSRSGASGGAVPLTLELRHADGAFVQTISTAALDLETAATGTWHSLPVSASVDFSPGQQFAFHAQLTGTGNMEVVVLFELNVQPGTYKTYLPLLRR
jgi:hypothetical protein